ncbi:NAD-binding protein [Lipomyces tetrasporus]|uniref:NAD-binding protein n=1 Tax=Lipomyces tetrasporus TaxID=54092 RepID=A0AAD7VQP8_9ASCO|nr:NAD-binding protein [Lipomyces tetrasporus]KAJ8098096.1 NAD-binding protein [Lipomyces tetrasporus]
MFSLEGKTALVTGGTRGIGRAIAIGLAEAGSNIILIQRDTARTETLNAIEAVGSKAIIVKCDLSRAEEVKELINHITQSLGHTIDILVNCGGIQRRHPAELFPDEDWNEVLQVNLTACFTLSRDVGRHMLETMEKKSQGYRGKIINFASLCSFQGGITVPAYATAKHGTLGMTKALSNDWVGKGINVNAVAPGYIATEMNTALIANPTRSRQIMERIPMGRWGTPDDFKGVVVFLASAASDYMSGDCVTVDGGWMAR